MAISTQELITSIERLVVASDLPGLRELFELPAVSAKRFAKKPGAVGNLLAKCVDASVAGWLSAQLRATAHDCVQAGTLAAYCRGNRADLVKLLCERNLTTMAALVDQGLATCLREGRLAVADYIETVLLPHTGSYWRGARCLPLSKKSVSELYLEAKKGGASSLEWLLARARDLPRVAGEATPDTAVATMARLARDAGVAPSGRAGLLPESEAIESFAKSCLAAGTLEKVADLYGIDAGAFSLFGAADAGACFRAACMDGDLLLAVWLAERYKPAKEVILQQEGTECNCFQVVCREGSVVLASWLIDRFSLCKMDAMSQDGWAFAQLVWIEEPLERMKFLADRFDLNLLDVSARDNWVVRHLLAGQDLAAAAWFVERFRPTREMILSKGCNLLRRICAAETPELDPVTRLKFLEANCAPTIGDLRKVNKRGFSAIHLAGRNLALVKWLDARFRLRRADFEPPKGTGGYGCIYSQDVCDWLSARWRSLAKRIEASQ